MIPACRYYTRRYNITSLDVDIKGVLYSSDRVLRPGANLSSAYSLGGYVGLRPV